MRFNFNQVFGISINSDEVIFTSEEPRQDAAGLVSAHFQKGGQDEEQGAAQGTAHR